MRELEIESNLAEIAAILRKYARKSWANELTDLAAEMQRAHGQRGYTLRLLHDIKSIYGGMGSLSDIYVTDKAGDPILPDDEIPVNKRLHQLRTQLYNRVEEEINLIESQIPKK